MKVIRLLLLATAMITNMAVFATIAEASYLEKLWDKIELINHDIYQVDDKKIMGGSAIGVYLYKYMLKTPANFKELMKNLSVLSQYINEGLETINLTNDANDLANESQKRMLTDGYIIYALYHQYHTYLSLASVANNNVARCQLYSAFKEVLSDINSQLALALNLQSQAPTFAQLSAKYSIFNDKESSIKPLVSHSCMFYDLKQDLTGCPHLAFIKNECAFRTIQTQETIKDFVVKVIDAPLEPIPPNDPNKNYQGIMTVIEEKINLMIGNIDSAVTDISHTNSLMNGTGQVEVKIDDQNSETIAAEDLDLVDLKQSIFVENPGVCFPDPSGGPCITEGSWGLAADAKNVNINFSMAADDKLNLATKLSAMETKWKQNKCGKDSANPNQYTCEMPKPASLFDENNGLAVKVGNQSPSVRYDIAELYSAVECDGHKQSLTDFLSINEHQVSSFITQQQNNFNTCLQNKINKENVDTDVITITKAFSHQLEALLDYSSLTQAEYDSWEQGTHSYLDYCLF